MVRMKFSYYHLMHELEDKEIQTIFQTISQIAEDLQCKTLSPPELCFKKSLAWRLIKPCMQHSLDIAHSFTTCMNTLIENTPRRLKATQLCIGCIV